MPEFSQIESKWRAKWDDAKIFQPEVSKSKKFYLTAAYPYIQGPQHIGHGRTYSIADVYARFKRMNGFNVLFPMGWHVTGTPILAISKRIGQGDRDLMEIYEKIYNVPHEELLTFSDTKKLIAYFGNEVGLGMKEMGFSIDWRREFNTGYPTYSKFIEWQFHQLKEKGLIKKGEHPVTWCPSCGNAIGEHDTLHDKKAKIEEFTIVKYKLADGKILPAATFRPETIFGATNLWINPRAIYVEAEVGNETWIISKEAAEKLKLQKDAIKVKANIDPRTLIEKKAKVPITGKEIPIFPASFVDSDNATGIVYSCPAHAPYDYMALVDMGKEHGADKIKLIAMIKSEKYGEFPAQEVCKRMGIKNQSDPRLEEATSEIYSAEFHKGTVTEIAGSYANMHVSEAKERVKEDLIKSNNGDIFFEIMNHPVICRCNTKCMVKILKNQWFIDYGDLGWKKKAHELVDKMSILPEESRSDYHNTIDWLHERACARRQGLGTKLPFDPDWLIESLSDSTIYMAYYTISRYVNEKKFAPRQLTPDLFSYIFLGKGNPEDLADETEIDEKTIKKMKAEFEYWYPLDSRHSATDLIYNHLTFFILNHVAIFPEKHQPRQIVTNGFVTCEGQKMSKSLGNIIPLRTAIKKYGADVVRLSVLYGSSVGQDTDFTETAAKTITSKIGRLMEFADEAGKKKKIKYSEADKWIISRLNRYLMDSEKLMENFDYRDFLNNILFMFDRDMSWYLKRSSERAALPEIMDNLARALSPFMPYSCEEIWEKLGHKPFVCMEKWPCANSKAISEEIEKEEEYLQNLIADIRNVIKLSKLESPCIYLSTTEDWKWDVMEMLKANNGDLGKTIPEACGKFAERKSEAPGYIQYLAKQGIWKSPIIKIDEAKLLKNSRDFLEKEIGTKVLVNDQEAIGKIEKKKSPSPLKPAIYVVKE